MFDTLVCPQEEEVGDAKGIIQRVKDFHADFHCQKCGKCCKEGVGVALWGHEFQRLKKLVPHIYQHIFMINTWHLLKMPCVFYDNEKQECSIYAQRPLACRLYPLGVRRDGSTQVSQNCTAIRAKEGDNK